MARMLCLLSRRPVAGDERWCHRSPMTTDYEQFFIGGGWVPPSSSERITVTGASTEEVVGGVPEGKPGDLPGPGTVGV